MDLEDSQFKSWLEANHPYVKLLFDEPVSIDGVNFFGGNVDRFRRRRYARHDHRSVPDERFPADLQSGPVTFQAGRCRCPT